MKPVSITLIQEVTATHFKIPVDDFLKPNHHRPYARPRQIAYWLSRRLTAHSYPKIGHGFRRDHATIMHGVDVVNRLIETDNWYGQEAKALEFAIRKQVAPETVE